MKYTDRNYVKVLFSMQKFFVLFLIIILFSKDALHCENFYIVTKKKL